MLQLIDELREEHRLIEKVVGSLLAYARARAGGAGDPRDGDAFLLFFHGYSGSFHHGREEDTLFPALVEKVELRSTSGPLASLLAQHHDMARTLSEMAPLLPSGLEAPGSGEALVDLASRYARALWQHIDAEDSVLLPESEERLRRCGVHELSGRPPGEAELRARAEGERLVAAYPPAGDPEAVRGEGCVVCPSYGVSCEGVEREWWSDSEWEEFSDHLG